MVEPEHLEGVLNHLPSALVTLGDDMTVLYRNRAAENLTPMIEPGRDIWDCLRPVISEEKIDRMLLREERIVFATDPDLPLLEWLINPGRLSDGSRILMAWDAGILDEMVQRRISFVVGAAHELRSPLTALLGFAEILELERETLSPSQAEAAEVILRNARHLSGLVDDIVDLTRNSFGELRLELEQIDVSPVVRGVVETLRPQIENKGQKLDVQIAKDLPPIDADPHRILQITLNLIQNAHVHTPPGTTIQVKTERVEYGVQLVVTDDGEGMPFEDPEQAFASFERGPSPGQQGNSGSGVGLTITRRMVELHRGLITVKSEPGKGTSFRVWLPLDRDEARRVIFSGEL